MATSYRSKYKEFYDIDFGPEYAIHHIDFNRDNNDISNLILLPRKLHARYHMCLNAVCLASYECSDLKSMFSLDEIAMHRGYGYCLKMLKQLMDTMEECEYWISLKETGYSGFLPEGIGGAA